MRQLKKVKSRGIKNDYPNRFSGQLSEDGTQHSIRSRSKDAEALIDLLELPSEDIVGDATEYIPHECNRIISKNGSPDLSFNLSLNPYQGCEHGCIYCYARPSHEYLDYSLGLDFESKIIFKTNALDKLIAFLDSPGYLCEPINIGSNTDPYQPIEKIQCITRSALELFQQTKHPVTLITKSNLILRDMDLLAGLAENQLCQVMVSVTTLSNKLKNQLEPRTAAPNKRLLVIEKLALAEIPVGVLVAPIIPAINDHEIEDIVKRCANAGAKQMHYILLRLPHGLKQLFYDWLTEHYPQRRDKVLNILAQCHKGELYQSEFGMRQQGTGVIAKLIRQRFEIACKQNDIINQRMTGLRTDLFVPPRNLQQLSLF